jgi:hypothetical protein
MAEQQDAAVIYSPLSPRGSEDDSKMGGGGGGQPVRSRKAI